MYEKGLVRTTPSVFPANSVKNRRYNLLTFVPGVLFEQFRMFQNSFYLCVCLSQLVPALQVGPLFASLAPLVFVISVTLLREAHDELGRWRRDRQANYQRIQLIDLRASLQQGSLVTRTSTAAALCVGDLLVLRGGEQVPVDGVLLKTEIDKSASAEGRCFVKTDQLDGETDWKLKTPIRVVQQLPVDVLLASRLIVETSSPESNFRRLEARFGLTSEVIQHSEGVVLDNILWAGSTIAGGAPVLLWTLYTGRERRQQLNPAPQSAKVGSFECQLNRISKRLFLLLFVLALILTFGRGITSQAHVRFARFLLLLSSIIPLSLRVNLDFAKMLYTAQIQNDKKIPNTIVRSSNICEELGSISYLLTDKTGTLTKNEMTFKRLYTGRGVVDYPRCADSLQKLRQLVRTAFDECGVGFHVVTGPNEALYYLRRFMLALCVCHVVMPAEEESGRQLQGSSPDELALVAFAEMGGLRLVHRSDSQVVISVPVNGHCIPVEFRVLVCLPFSSSKKRMGVVVQFGPDQKVVLLMKGADCTMVPRLKSRGSHWISEEVDSLAREGLRTLVFAVREFSKSEWEIAEKAYQKSLLSLGDRSAKVEAAADHYIESKLDLVGVTGVEDVLQANVQGVIESLQQAGIRICMLTGDKVETATCVAIAAGLLKPSRHRLIVVGSEVATSQEALQAQLDDLEREVLRDVVLIVDGSVVGLALDSRPEQFIRIFTRSLSVVCCRCSPTDKMRVTELISRLPRTRTCCVGDGGNDVPMISAAHVGVGVVGKEGNQASMASDFSVDEFQAIRRLLLVHGRADAIRSSKLSNFVIHRGLLITFMQVIFSALFYFISLPIFQGWLQVGYTTIYTMLPVFSLATDIDLPERVVMVQYPELYSVARDARKLSYRSLLMWTFKSLYQAVVIMLGSLILFEKDFMNVIAISFSSLVLAEIFNVASEIHTWTRFMVMAEIASVLVYLTSMLFMPATFNPEFVGSQAFWLKVLVITLLAWLPLQLAKIIGRKFWPTHGAKLLKGVDVRAFIV
ncbi:MAG: hypothetical protein KVP17_003764 [Porospora cf. gigantea B]|nr:MAG: hypothetical protein KVP17_003764 [Porospora cf. gigantea B]